MGRVFLQRPFFCCLMCQSPSNKINQIDWNLLQIQVAVCYLHWTQTVSLSPLCLTSITRQCAWNGERQEMVWPNNKQCHSQSKRCGMARPLPAYFRHQFRWVITDGSWLRYWRWCSFHQSLAFSAYIDVSSLHLCSALLITLYLLYHQLSYAHFPLQGYPLTWRWLYLTLMLFHWGKTFFFWSGGWYLILF